MDDTTLQDWETTTDILFHDVLRAAEGVDGGGDGFVRRSYVRAVFAAVEGTTYGMKRVVLHLWKHRQSTLSADDLELLTETKMDQQGRSRKRFLPFADNIKFVFEVFAKVHGFVSSADYCVKTWQSLLAAAKIRDKLMHPKSSAELDVSEQDMETMREGADWYFTTRNRLVAQATHELRKGI